MDRANKIEKRQCWGKVLSGANFSKSSKFSRNFENFKKSRNFENPVEGGAPALRVVRAGTRLTVHRSLPLLLFEGRTPCSTSYYSSREELPALRIITLQAGRSLLYELLLFELYPAINNSSTSHSSASHLAIKSNATSHSSSFTQR